MKPNSRIVEGCLVAEGVRIHFHTELAEILAKNGRLVGVRTKDGREFKCEILAMAIGVLPQVELAARFRLEHPEGDLGGRHPANQRTGDLRCWRRG